MEDDEIYHEHNQVHQYLSSCEEFSGCYDVIKVPVKINENLDKGVGLDLVATPSRHGPTHNTMHNAIQYHLDSKILSHQLCKILECGLMLEEDSHYIENIVDSCQLCQSQQHFGLGWNRSKLLLIGSAFLASTGMLYYTTSRCMSVSFSMATVSYAVWESYKMKQQQRQVQIIEEFLSVLHQLFQVLKKSIQLIQENEILVRGNVLARSSGIDFSSLPSQIAKWQLMISLRLCVSNTVRQTVVVFINGTRQLINAIPLAGQLNLNQNYLATLDEDPLNWLKLDDDLPLGTLKHNHSIYLLLQSEYLRQLALCFCPKLWLYNSPKQLRDVHSITTAVISEMSQLTATLKREYLAFYSYGLNDKRKSKTAQPSWKYSDVYVATHSAVLHLQAMLLKTRTIEELLEKNGNKNENFLDNIENVFEDVLNENDSFESCCKEGIAQLRKLKAVDAKTDSSKQITPDVESVGIVPEHVNKQEDYVVEDEVFEATSFENELSREEHCDTVVLSKEERVKREIERQLSRRMVKELKTVLVSKSTEWKERERKALLKKAGLDPSAVEDVSPLTELPCCEGEWPLPRLKTGLPRRYSSSGSSRRRSSLNVECILALNESDAAVSLPLCLPPPPPPPPLSQTQEQDEGETKQTPSELETILKGAERFWSLRNQFVEDTFSGSGESLLEEIGNVSETIGQDEETTELT